MANFCDHMFCGVAAIIMIIIVIAIFFLCMFLNCTNDN